MCMHMCMHNMHMHMCTCACTCAHAHVTCGTCGSQVRMAISAQPGMPLFACVSLTERGVDTEGQPICRSVHGFHRFEWRQSRLLTESATIARYVNLVKVDLVCHLWLDGTAYVEEKRRCSGVAHCAKREIRRRHPCRRVREKDGRRALHSSQKLVDIHQVHHMEKKERFCSTAGRAKREKTGSLRVSTCGFRKGALGRCLIRVCRVEAPRRGQVMTWGPSRSGPP